MTSVLVRTEGTTDTYQLPGLSWTGIGAGGRNSLRLSNGNFLYIVVDKNQSATSGQGDNTGNQKIYVYERAVSTNVVTLRATIAAGAGVIADQAQGALFANDDLAIVWNDGMQGGPYWKRLKYCKMTYSTYAVS